MNAAGLLLHSELPLTVTSSEPHKSPQLLAPNFFTVTYLILTCHVCIDLPRGHLPFRFYYFMKRVKPIRCYTMVYWTLWITQHVSGITMTIVRSLRLYRWSQRMAPHLGYGRLLVWYTALGFGASGRSKTQIVALINVISLQGVPASNMIL